MYTCKRCGYNTKIKCNFKSHLNRKRICPPTLENVPMERMSEELVVHSLPITHKIPQIPPYNSQNHQNPPYNSQNICEYCDTKFTRKDNLVRHQRKHCKSKKLLIKENEKFKEQINKLTTKAKTGAITNITNINLDNSKTLDNSKNFNLNDFGKENKKMIDGKENEFIDKYGIFSVGKALEYVHFNEKFPENMNITKTNKRDDFFQIREDGEWKELPKKSTLDKINDIYEEFRKKNISLILEKDKLFEEMKNTEGNFIPLMERVQEIDKMIVESKKQTDKESNKYIESVIITNRRKVSI